MHEDEILDQLVRAERGTAQSRSKPMTLPAGSAIVPLLAPLLSTRRMSIQ
jgi:hypothetical protein